jgi:hypothetical protein
MTLLRTVRWKYASTMTETSDGFSRYSGALVRQRTIPTERPPLVGEVSANLADRGCRAVSATNPHGG